MSFMNREKRRLERKAERYLIAIIAVLAVSIISRLGYESVAGTSDGTNDSEVVEQVSEINDTEETEFTEETVVTAADVEFQEATLIRVVDGDTIIVSIDGKKSRVRLIGIDTPESVAPESSGKANTEEGVFASDYVKDLLADTTTVYLQKDVSDTDQYDRLLRYVWLKIPEDAYNVNEISTKMLNGILLLDKVAEPVTFEPDTSYKELFEYIYTTPSELLN